MKLEDLILVDNLFSPGIREYNARKIGRLV